MNRREFLELAATVAAAPRGVDDDDATAQQHRLVELADRDEDERWEYAASEPLAGAHSDLLDVEIDDRENPTSTVKTYQVGSRGVPLAVGVSTERSETVQVNTLVHLDAGQAEAIAVDLLEQAHAVRELGGDQ